MPGSVTVKEECTRHQDNKGQVPTRTKRTYFERRKISCQGPVIGLSGGRRGLDQCCWHVTGLTQSSDRRCHGGERRASAAARKTGGMAHEKAERKATCLNKIYSRYHSTYPMVENKNKQTDLRRGVSHEVGTRRLRFRSPPAVGHGQRRRLLLTNRPDMGNTGGCC